MFLCHFLLIYYKILPCNLYHYRNRSFYAFSIYIAKPHGACLFTSLVEDFLGLFSQPSIFTYNVSKFLISLFNSGFGEGLVKCFGDPSKDFGCLGERFGDICKDFEDLRRGFDVLSKVLEVVAKVFDVLTKVLEDLTKILEDLAKVFVFITRFLITNSPFTYYISFSSLSDLFFIFGLFFFFQYNL